ncbi:MAG: hypothetical protein IGS03_14220 [Candidatus Sericytochromatia bacterium]|nr:hypothetical protein [Candidatus Sericytochromatia bacterium]
MMPNLLLKLLDQWIDSIALPPESRGRFSVQTNRSEAVSRHSAVPVQADSQAFGAETLFTSTDPESALVAEVFAASSLSAVSQTASEENSDMPQPAPDELCDNNWPVDEADSTDDILSEFNWD